MYVLLADPTTAQRGADPRNSAGNGAGVEDAGIPLNSLVSLPKNES